MCACMRVGFVRVCVGVCMRACVQSCARVCMCVCVRAYVRACVFVCAYVCMYVCRMQSCRVRAFSACWLSSAGEEILPKSMPFCPPRQGVCTGMCRKFLALVVLYHRTGPCT